MVRLAESIVWPWVSQTRAALMASGSVSYGPFILTSSPYVDTQILRCTSVHQRRSQASLSTSAGASHPAATAIDAIEEAGAAKSGQGNRRRRGRRDVRSLTWEVIGALGGTRTPSF